MTLPVDQFDPYYNAMGKIFLVCPTSSPLRLLWQLRGQAVDAIIHAPA